MPNCTLPLGILWIGIQKIQYELYKISTFYHIFGVSLHDFSTNLVYQNYRYIIHNYRYTYQYYRLTVYIDIAVCTNFAAHTWLSTITIYHDNNILCSVQVYYWWVWLTFISLNWVYATIWPVVLENLIGPKGDLIEPNLEVLRGSLHAFIRTNTMRFGPGFSFFIN